MDKITDKDEFNYKNREYFNRLKKLEKGTEEYNELRNEIVMFNQKLIPMFMYKKNLNISSSIFVNCGIDYQDIEQELLISLMKAVEKYDPDHERKASFSTYAFFYLHSGLMSMLKTRMVGIPKRYNINEMLESFKNEMNIVSLDEKYSEEDILYDQNVQDIFIFGERGQEQDVERDIAIKSLDFEDTLKCLSEKDIDIFIEYYYNNKTLESIGKKYNLTRERIRQRLNKSKRLLWIEIRKRGFCEAMIKKEA